MDYMRRFLTPEVIVFVPNQFFVKSCHQACLKEILLLHIGPGGEAVIRDGEIMKIELSSPEQFIITPPYRN